MPSVTAPARQRLLWLVPAIAFGATLFFRIASADVWWHVRTGRWIVEHRSIPVLDPFSHTMANGPWRYTDALAQVLYHFAYESAGVAGLTVLHAAIGVAIALTLGRLAGASVGASSLVIGLWGASSLAAMAMKPQGFSYLSFALLLWILKRADEGKPGALYFLPLLFAVWGNLHRAGTLGLLALGAYGLVWLFSAGKRRPLALPAVGVGLLSTLALTLNSGGVFYLLSGFGITTRSDFIVLSDWQPLSFAMLVERHLAIAPLLLLWLGGRFRPKPRRLDAELLIVLGTAILTVRTGRFMPFFATALAAGAGRGAEALLEWTQPYVRRSLSEAAGILLGVAILAFAYTTLLPPSHWGVGIVESRVPTRVASFLAEHPPGGKMWNSFNLGGYLLFALAPEQKVFIDGRNDTVYEGPFFAETLRAPRDPTILAKQIAEYDVGYVVAQHADLGGRGLAALATDPGWELVYWDDVAAVFVDRSRVDELYLRSHGYPALQPATALQHAASLRPGPQSEADAAFLRDVERRLSRTPSSIGAHYLAALAYRQLHRSQDYERARNRVLQLSRERGVEITPP